MRMSRRKSILILAVTCVACCFLRWFMRIDGVFFYGGGRTSEPSSLTVIGHDLMFGNATSRREYSVLVPNLLNSTDPLFLSLSVTKEIEEWELLNMGDEMLLHGCVQELRGSYGQWEILGYNGIGIYVLRYSEDSRQQFELAYVTEENVEVTLSCVTTYEVWGDNIQFSVSPEGRLSYVAIIDSLPDGGYIGDVMLQYEDKVLKVFEGEHVAWMNNETLLIENNKKIIRWDVQTGKSEPLIDKHGKRVYTYYIPEYSRMNVSGKYLIYPFKAWWQRALLFFLNIDVNTDYYYIVDVETGNGRAIKVYPESDISNTFSVLDD